MVLEGKYSIYSVGCEFQLLKPCVALWQTSGGSHYSYRSHLHVGTSLRVPMISISPIAPSL